MNQNKKICHSPKCIWKYRLRNGGHFVQGDELTAVKLWHGWAIISNFKFKRMSLIIHTTTPMLVSLISISRKGTGMGTLTLYPIKYTHGFASPGCGYVFSYRWIDMTLSIFSVGGGTFVPGRSYWFLSVPMKSSRFKILRMFKHRKNINNIVYIPWV